MECHVALGSKISATARTKNSNAKKFFGGAKILKKLDRVVAIDFVKKSSKSELASRFLSRLKFAFRTQEMSCFEHKECPASNTRNVLLRIHGMSCFEHKECPASRTRNVLLGNDQMSYARTRNLLRGNDEFLAFVAE